MFPLIVRSCYSLMHGTASPAMLCRLAKHLGYSGLALTDRDNLYGLWPFLAACRQEGLRPVVGAELSSNDFTDKVVCLVRDAEGYADLCCLLTRRKSAGKFDLFQEMSGSHQGLIVLGKNRRILANVQQQGGKVAADLGPRPSQEGRALRQWAREHGIPAVATPDSSLAATDEAVLQDLLLAIGANSTMAEAMASGGEQGQCLFAADTYEKRFAVWPGVTDASEQLADECCFQGPDFGTVMPPWQGGMENVEQVLRNEAYIGARGRYGDTLSGQVVQRLEHELQVIAEKGFSSYFLVVRDIVFSHVHGNQGRKPRVCGRGSGAASLVAYCLGVTNVCPLRYNLYFERFLNPGRLDPPDIDIDFSWDERDKLLAHVLHSHKGYAAMVSTLVRFQPRMALRETAKAFGMSEAEIQAADRRISKAKAGQDGEKDSLAGQPWEDIMRLSARLQGIPRCLSVHPGGVVITPRPIYEYVPVEISSGGVPVIQWDKNGAEDAGLVKIDLLGNRSLGVIRDCLINVAEEGWEINEDKWHPEQDSATKATVARGMTMGCFYIESPAMRQLMQKAGTGEFEQLVMQSSLIRPAANEFVREYIRRLHGGKWPCLHNDFEEVLRDSFGLMVYQEDVSRVAVKLAGFSHSRADRLRKVLSKKDRHLTLESYQDEFLAGCRANNIAEQASREVWKMVMSFKGYSFCKAHSASYAGVSFQAAYLKTHFPAEFMAAVISNQGGYYSTFAYVSEAKRLGLTIVRPDINRSKKRWWGNGRTIIVGFQAVQGISGNLVERIRTSRQSKPFADARDFFSRACPAEDEARALIHAGALDLLQEDGNRTMLVWELVAWQQQRKDKKRGTLFELTSPPPSLPRVSRIDCLRMEYKSLGFLCSCHPVTLVRQNKEGAVRAKDLHHYVGRNIFFTGWMLTGKRITSGSGRLMEFVTFEDETGLVETVFFPDSYRCYGWLLETGCPFMLKGKVEEDCGVVTLTVEQIKRI